MTVRTRLAMVFTILVVLIWAAIFFSVNASRNAQQKFNEMEEHMVPSLIALNEIETIISDTSNVMDYAIYGGKEEAETGGGEPAQDIWSLIDNMEARGRDILTQSAHQGPEEREIALGITGNITALKAAMVSIFHLKEQGAGNEILLAWERESIRPVMINLQRLAKKQNVHHMAEMTALRAAFDSTKQRTTYALVIIGGLIGLLALAAAIFTTRSIVRPLHALHRGTEMVEQGNLDFKVGTGARDEIGQLSRAFDHMTRSLSKSMTSIDNLNQEINERRQAEEALKNSEEFSTSLLENAPNPIIVTNEDTFIKYVNPAFEELTGFTPAEVIGAGVPYPWWPEEFRDKYTTAVRKHPMRRFKMMERICRKKNGERFWAVINSTPVKNGGKRDYSLVNMLDISGPKQMEEEIRRQNKFLNAVLEAVTNPLYVIDANDYTVKLANSAARFGDLAEHPTCYSVTHGYPKPCGDGDHICPMEEIRATKKPVVVEHFHGDRYMEVHGFPILDKEGNLSQIIEYSLDITERKQAEEQIKHAAQEWRTTFDAINEYISVHDSNFKITRVNQPFARVFRMRPEDIIGKTCYELIHGTTEPLPECPHRQAMKTKQPAVAEYFEPQLGIYLEATASPIFDEAGEVVNCVHVARDITKRKQAEDKMRQIDSMKTEFLSNVSHELRTPLQSINGFIKLILNGAVPDPATQLEFLHIVDREGEYLGNLINDLLDMSRLESGRFEINKGRLSIRDTIIDALKLSQGFAREKNIMLREEIPPRLPVLEADGERLRQVIINLLNNAVKFSDPGSRITVRAAKRDGELLFQTTDHGIGIPAEAMPHLFERFYRAENKMVRGGAGLGLYISRQIIEAHGGHIWAESEPDKGSTFSFTLPLNGKGGKAHGKEDSGH